MSAPRPPLSRRTSGILWLVVLVATVLLEGYALGSRNGATLSQLVREQLQHPVGRYVFYPLWCWLTWHWFLSPSAAVTWRDAIAIAAGACLAWLARGRVV